MLKKTMLAAAAAVALAAAPAYATVTFNVTGTFSSLPSGGTSLGTLTGQFTTADDLKSVTGYSLTASAAGTFTGFVYTPVTSSVSASVLPSQYFQIDTPGNIDELRLYFASALTTAGTTLSSTFSYEHEPTGGNRYLSGTITRVVTGAVPEPATWGMMILGMGAIGYAMRRRKVAARVSFAG